MLCPKKEGYDGRERMPPAATSPYANVRYAGCLDPNHPLWSPTAGYIRQVLSALKGRLVAYSHREVFGCGEP